MNTSDPPLCPTCGESIPPEAPDGICPKCLLGGILEQGVPLPAEFPIEEVRERFPDFDVIELIGVGGIGRVYKVRDPRIDRVVALKILSPDRAENPEWIERFTREAKALARLNHPHIVQVHAFGTDPQPHLVMEFVAGLNLRQVMESGGMSAREALVIVPKLCSALHYAHEHGVLHRDIKPENVLVDSEGRVKLVDFGLAKLHDEDSLPFTLTQSGSKLGTIAYMAPEQIETPSDVDHRADIYSLGVVFYEMLTGELPLGRFPSPSEANGTDPRLDGVVLRTLEKKKEKRFPDAESMGSKIEDVGQTVATTPRQVEEFEPNPSITRPTRSHWKKATALLAVLVFGLSAYLAIREKNVATSLERLAKQEAAALEAEEQRQQKKAESAARDRSYEQVRDWIARASVTNDPEKKANAISEMLEAIKSADKERNYAGLRAFGYLSKIKMDRSAFREPLRQLMKNDDWEIRSHAITALFMTDFERTDIEMILEMIDTVPNKNLASISSALHKISGGDFTGEYAEPILRLLNRGVKAEKERPSSVTWVPNRSLLGAFWGSRVTPEIEAIVIDWTRLDTTEDRPMNTNSPGYYAFYSALSVFANKSTPSVKRLIELASNPDSTNIAGRCFWGLNGTVPDKGDQKLVADAVIRVLGHRNDDYMWRQGIRLLQNYASAEHKALLSELASREELSDDYKSSLTSIIDAIAP